MTRLRGAIFVCIGSGLGAFVAGAGCSSSSNPTAPGGDAAADTEVVSPDGGAADGAVTTLTLQWGVGELQGGNSYIPDGGAREAGTDGGVNEAGAEGGASDAGTEAGAGDAGTEAGAGDASEEDGGPGDGGAAAAEGGDDAGARADAADGGSSALPPLPGVTVCVYQNPKFPCVTTQADGSFTIPGLPVRTQLVLSLVKTGYSSYLLPIETASTDMDVRGSPAFMSPSADPPDIGVPVNVKDKGVIVAFAVSASGANQSTFTATLATTIALSPPSGNGPYYVNNANQIILSATSFVGSTALFYNVDPGTYTLTYANPGYDCEPISFPFGQYGVPVTTPPHSVQVTVGPAYVTGIVGVLCTVNATVVAVDGG